MNIRRILSYLAVAVLAAMIYTTWSKDYPPAKTPDSQVTSGSTSQSAAGFVPSTFTPGKDSTNKKEESSKKIPALPSVVKQTGQLIQVKTDVLQLVINLDGGAIISAKLPEYPVSASEKNIPEQILSSESQKFYVAQSGLTNTAADGKTSAILFKASQMQYTLIPGNKTLSVTLTGKTNNGLTVVKTFTLSKGSYAVKVQYNVSNNTSKTWQGSLYTQLVRKEPEQKGHLFYTRSYNGAAISSPDVPYKKVTYKEMAKNPINQTNKGGWVAMQQHYFLSAWVPASQEQENAFYSHKQPNTGKNLFTIGFVSPSLTVPSGQSGITSATLYVGPELAKNLNALAPGLERTIDYGWLWWFSVVIFWLMSLVHYVVGNWGWAIVITTIIIKLILYPLSATSFRSMARMRELQPKMQRLKEQYGDDRQGLSRATMELYRKEKINPVGGCLPMIIQIPVFIALYFVIIEAIQLRQAPFIFWIHDLSVKDPYYILPILMGLSMLLQQRLTPSSPDPTQAKVMMVIPVVFTFFFLNFPAGLTLYWFVNNCVQMLQQWWVNKTMDAHMAKKARKRKKKAKTTNIFKK